MGKPRPVIFRKPTIDVGREGRRSVRMAIGQQQERKRVERASKQARKNAQFHQLFAIALGALVLACSRIETQEHRRGDKTST